MANFETVLEGAQAGEDWAARCLYDELHPSLLRYLRWKERAVAEDLASETWLAVAEGIRRFEGDEEAFRGWVFTIARRRLADHHRREGRRRTSPAPDYVFLEAASSEDPSEMVADRMSAQTAIARLASMLPAEQAEVVVLRVVGGLPVEEVPESSASDRAPFGPSSTGRSAGSQRSSRFSSPGVTQSWPRTICTST